MAILLVVLFHFSVPGFSAGFIGVDVFFVISGFLITQILLAREEGGHVSLRSFYLSRASRIYPPMLALVGILLALGYLFLAPDEYLRLGRHSLFSLAGVANYRFYSETGYFAPDRESNWLLHLWSLSVELQFYLAVPPIILWAHRRGRRRLMYVLLGLCGLSFASGLYFSFRDASAAFYFMPLRLWEFLAGALAFGARDAVTAVWRRHLPRLGLALIAVALPIISLGVLPQTAIGVLPVVGSALVLAVPSHGWLLTNPVSQFIGLISYSFYLWHWPVWLAARHFDHARTALDVAGLFVLTLVLALASRLAIERTFQRRPAGRPTWRGIVMASAVCAVVAVAGVVVRQSGLPKRVPPLVADVLGAALTEESIRQDRCFLSPPDGGEKLADECFAPVNPSQGAEVLLFGDSHAAHLWPGFAHSPALQSFRLTQATAGACPPLLLDEPDAAPTRAPGAAQFHPVTGIVVQCASITRRAFSHIERARPRVVVLSARWSYYDAHATDVVKELRKVILALTRLQVHGVIVGPTPEWTPALPQKALEETFRHGGRLPARMHDASHAALEKLDRRLAAMSREVGAGYVSLRELLCTGDGCMASVSSRGKQALIASDVAHLTIPGSEWIVDHAVAPAVVRDAEGGSRGRP